MKRERLFTLPSPFRDEFRIQGFRFGSGKKSLAIIGAMRGDEYQQQYICAQLVSKLQDLEDKGVIIPNNEILIIPCANPFAMNIGKRFWAMDNTDINRMFPGYDRGETTQRIAAAIFEHIQGYQFGIQMESFYLSGDFIPHVRIIQTGFEKPEYGQDFGLPYTLLRKPKPYDTTTLNYNWQIWETQAFSLYSGHMQVIDPQSANLAVVAILRFMMKHGIVVCKTPPGFQSEIIRENNLVNIKARRAGVFYCISKTNDIVHRDQVLAQILDPYDGSIRWEVHSPVEGTVFFAYNKALTLENAILFRIIVE